MCSNVRILTAAIAGYLIGGLSGSALAAWVLMAAGGAAMFFWSRTSDRRNGATCAVPRTRPAWRSESQRPASPLGRLGSGSGVDERVGSGGGR